mgnify:CR=1 FL=1
MKKNLNKNLNITNFCSICESSKKNNLGKIVKCNNADLNELFSLISLFIVSKDFSL